MLMNVKVNDQISKWNTKARQITPLMVIVNCVHTSSLTRSNHVSVERLTLTKLISLLIIL